MRSRRTADAKPPHRLNRRQRAAAVRGRLVQGKSVQGKSVQGKSVRGKSGPYTGQPKF